jgi:hypothetical protein
VILRLASFFRLSVRELTALVLLFALSLPAVTLRLYASDEVQYYAYLRSLWFDRDVSFDNEYRHLYEAGVARSTLFSKTFIEPATDTGLRRNFATLGSAILWSPFYAIADVSARAARAFGSDTPADGYSKPYIAAVCLGSALYGFVAILLSIRLARALTGSGLRASVAVWAGTPLAFYMYVAPAFGHATSAFAVTLFITVWLHVRRAWSPGGVAALAAAGALMTMVREQDVFFAIGPAVDFLIARSSFAGARDQETRPRAGASIAMIGIAIATFVTVLAPQLIAYQALNGRFGPSPLVGRKMTWTSPHGLEVLLSPDHGFFFWTPLAALALAGLIVMALSSDGRGADQPETSDRRRIAVILILMTAATVYVTGSVESWTAAGAFGQRRFVNLTPVLAVGLAALFARTGRATFRSRAASGALVVVAALCIWWNVALVAQFGTHMMNRQRLELARNARTAFITLPVSGPRLVYRYFFDRQSFYRPDPPGPPR